SGPGGPGAAPGGPGGMPGAAAGGPEGMPGGGGAGGPGGERKRGGFGGPGGAGFSEEQRAAMFARMVDQLPTTKKKEIEKEMGGKKMQDLSAEQRNKIFSKLRESSQGAGGPGGRAEGGPGRGEGGGGRQRAEGAPPALIGGFTEADRENAKLP